MYSMSTGTPSVGGMIAGGPSTEGWSLSVASVSRNAEKVAKSSMDVKDG